MEKSEGLKNKSVYELEQNMRSGKRRKGRDVEEEEEK